MNTSARWRRRLLLATVFAAILIALVVVVIQLIDPIPPAPVLAVAPSDPENLLLPANSYSASATKRLKEELPESIRGAAVTVAGPGESETWWEAIPAGDRPVVIYFAVHGGVVQGKPVLWLKPDRPLPVADIIRKIGELPAERPKLLILDGAQVPSDWVRGQLVNDFARAVKSLEADIQGVPKLVVFLSADADQRSWISEEWREPVFSFYLREGLKGAAGKEDSRITAERLFAYVSERVKSWAVAARDAEQTPVLLPGGEGAKRAAELRLVSVRTSAYQVPSAATAPGASFSVPPEVTSTWKKVDSLLKHQPPPESAAPHLFREYLDTALRLELLARAGVELGPTRRSFDSQHEALMASGGATRSVAALNSLPASRGLRLAAVEPNRAVFQSLWSAPTDAARKAAWEREVDSARTAKQDELTLRIGVMRELVDQVLTGSVPMTREGLEKVEAVLALVETAAGRPVECHYLRILKAHLPSPGPPAELVQQAVKLRVAAEQVAWLAGAGSEESIHAETVYLWIASAMSEADAARRLGEDLLFGPDAASWKKANEYLTTAAECYKRAEETARTVNAALRVRDRTRTRLPYYARWVADSESVLPAADLDALVQQVEKAATGSHRLEELLEATPTDLTQALKLLAATTRETDDNATAVFAVFDRELAKLGGAVSPSAWHALDSALQVPFISSGKREQLLLDLRNVSHQLNVKFEDLSAPPPAASRKYSARDRGQRHGRLALALLGERWVTDPASRSAAPPNAAFVGLAELNQRILRPNESAWWESIRAAGDQIGWHLRSVPAGVSAARAQADSSPLEKSLPHLIRASVLGRLADPSAPLAKVARPSEDERRLRTHDFLLWQLDRTVADGWAEVNPLPGIEHYCVAAANRYATTAQLLAGGDAAGLDSREKARRAAPVAAARLRIQPPLFSLSWPQDQALTDEKEWKIDYQLKAPSNFVVGLPILRYSDPHGPFKPSDASRPTAEVLSDFAGRTSPPTVTRSSRFEFVGKSADAGGTVSASLLYRGHLRPMTTQISMAGRPTIEWIHRPPSGPASFMVLGDASLRYGAVTLLVDGSFSMNDDLASGKSKFDAACDALAKVLANLDKRVILTVASFGGGTDGAPGIYKLFGPAQGWNPDKVLKFVVDKKPYGDSTPLSAAMQTAIRDPGFWPRNFGGYRNLVVLSDGEDTVAEPQAGRTVGSAVVTTLVNNPEDVALSLILFGDPNGLRKAEAQFKTIENPTHFEEGFRTPGRLLIGIDDVKKLVTSLEDSMLPRIQILQDEGKLRRLSRGTGVTLFGEALWREPQSLDPGRYQLRALGSYHWLRLDPGDRTVLRMTREGGKIRLDLATLANTRSDIFDSSRFTRKEGAIQLTVPRNSVIAREKGYDLQLDAALEKPTVGRSADLARVDPLFAWFEVAAEGKSNKPGRSLRVENLTEHIAPAWQLTVSPWEVEDRSNADPARVTAYWVEGWPAEAKSIPLPAFRNAAVGVPAEHRAFTVGDVSVQVLGMYMADDSLHVRLKHDPKKPVIARLIGLREEPRLGQEEEHRFYEAAAVYSARFGRFNPADRDKPLTLVVYPLEAVKRVAQKVELMLPKPEFNHEGWMKPIPAQVLVKGQ